MKVASKFYVSLTNPMGTIRFNAIRLTIAVTILGSCSFAQNQDPHDAQTKLKWLTCDVDWIFTPYDVGPDFAVNLSFHQVPLLGIRVALNPNGGLADSGERRKAPVTVVTDSAGTAHFLAVPPGKYTADAKDGLLFPSNEVTVHAGGDFEEEISIEWPLSLLPVRTLRGQLIEPGKGTANRPFQWATVELVDLRSSRVMEAQRTTADGSYEFSRTEPGPYVVRIIPVSKDKKAEPKSGLGIELDPVAQESTIPQLKVVQSECAGVQLLRRTANDEWEAQ
jgi:hypothetical protein